MVSLDKEAEMINNPDRIEARRKELIAELGPKHLTHAANQAVFRPAELSILEQFALERMNERKTG